jgi:hypothetical protein
MSRASTALLAFLLVGGVGAAKAVGAADRYRFEPRVSVGDVYEVTARRTQNVKIPAAPEGDEAATGFVMTSETKTLREVLAERAGQATELRLTFLVAGMETTAADGKKLGMSLPNAGRTFLLRKKNGKVVVTSADGKVDKATRQGFSNTLDLAGPIRFPKVELAVGDDWDVPGEENATTGTVERTQAKFTGVTEEQGEPRARIQISKSTIISSGLPIPGVSSFSMTTRLEGHLQYSARRQRPIEMTLVGPTQMTGTTMKDGKEFPFTTSGETRETYEEKWIKIAGKPVADVQATNTSR